MATICENMDQVETKHCKVNLIMGSYMYTGTQNKSNQWTPFFLNPYVAATSLVPIELA